MKKTNYKTLFEIYFDGFDDIESAPDVPNTFQMGVCLTTYSEKRNTLTVYLRRPGLLIGKGGKTLDAVSKYLDCKIEVVEFNPFL